MTNEIPPNVGYMSPPEHTRFKKGKSGNPRGRPRKRDDLNSVLQRVLKRKVRIKDLNQEMPIQGALIWKLRDFALQGDKQALALQRRILTEAGHDTPEPTSLEEKREHIRKIAEDIRAIVEKDLVKKEESDEE